MPADSHPSMTLAELRALYAAGTAVVTPDEAQPWVVLKVSRSSFYRAMQRGEIPGVCHLGRARRLQLRALLEFLGALPENGDTP